MKSPLPSVRRFAPRLNNQFSKRNQKAATHRIGLRIAKLVVALVLVTVMALLFRGVGVKAAGAAGDVDPTFNVGGSGANGAVNAMVVQPDGKILIGGQFNQYNGSPTTSVARLNQDGSLDNSFNIGLKGPVTTVNALALQPDGKILVGGTLVLYNGAIKFRGILRLNQDGSLDDTFNADAPPQRQRCIGFFRGCCQCHCCPIRWKNCHWRRILKV